MTLPTLDDAPIQVCRLNPPQHQQFMEKQAILSFDATGEDHRRELRHRRFGDLHLEPNVVGFFM